MPIYEYTCEKCHETQEIIQGFNEKAPEICPQCHAVGTLKKSVTKSAFHLKGGGWYKDLYTSKKDESKKTETEKKAPKDTEAVARTGTDKNIKKASTTDD